MNALLSWGKLINDIVRGACSELNTTITQAYRDEA